MQLRRTQARIRRWVRVLSTVIAFALLGAFVFVIGALFNALGSILFKWAALAHVSILFAIFGALFGTVLALDRSADVPPWMLRFIRRFEAPVLRTSICAVLGAVAVIFLQSWLGDSFEQSWVIVGAGAGAILGWFGWRWAKYVDF